MNRRVVVTGLGILSPLGYKLDEFSSNLRQGISGVKTISRFDASSYPSRIGGEIRDFNPEEYLDPKFLNKTDRFSQLGVIAASFAIKDANLNLNSVNRNRIGVTMGTSVSGFGVAEEQHTIFLEKGFKRINPYMQTAVFPSSCSSYIALYYNLHGPAESISTACASSNSAIGLAMQRIRAGECDIMIAGGSDAPVTPFILGSFCILRLVSKRNDTPEQACRPFSKDRDGLALSEGAAVLVLEDMDHALKRDARIYGEILGFGTSCDAFHITSPHPKATYSVMAMEKSLKDAGIDKEEIEYINAHGSATPTNDRIETLAIKKLFGNLAYKIPVSATKSMIGHTMGACGSIELVACFLMLKNDFIHPTINYTTPDPECDLFYVPEKVLERRIDTIMSNSFGYGGQNAVLIIRRFQGP